MGGAQFLWTSSAKSPSVLFNHRSIPQTMALLTSAKGNTPLTALIASSDLGGEGSSIYDWIIGMIAAIEVCSSLALELATTPVGTRVVVAEATGDTAFGTEDTSATAVLEGDVALVDAEPGDAVDELGEEEEERELWEPILEDDPEL